MKKFSSKSFILGMVVMLLIGLVFTPGFAAMVQKTITVQTGIKVYNDDQLIRATNAKGEVVEPFIYNGTTYLPVRAIADAVGKPVSYDPKTQSVYLGTHESAIPVTTIHKLKSYKTNINGVENNTKDNNGVFYNETSYVSFETDADGYANYMINGMYSRTKGSLLIRESKYDTISVCILKIYGDDVLLYTSNELKAGMKAIVFDVDISGVSNLKYEIVMMNNNNSISFALGDVGLYQ